MNVKIFCDSSLHTSIQPNLIELLQAMGYKVEVVKDPADAALIVASPRLTLSLLGSMSPMQIIAYPSCSAGDYIRIGELIVDQQVVHPDAWSRDCWKTTTTKIADAFHCKNLKIKADYVRNDIKAKDEASFLESFEGFKMACSSVVSHDLLTAFTDGCISCRHGDGMIITRSYLDKRTVQPTDLCVVSEISAGPTISGRWLEGARPSSSTPWHWELYRKRPDISWVLHGHCKMITYGSTNQHLRTDSYAPYGTREVFESMEGLVTETDFLVLTGHGEVSVGKSMNDCIEQYLNILSYEKSHGKGSNYRSDEFARS